MSYDINEVVKIAKIFNNFESEAKNFLFLASFPMKNKENKIKSAHLVLKTIESYNKLPLEIRNELEKDKTNNASKLNEIEKLCKEAII